MKKILKKAALWSRSWMPPRGAHKKAFPPAWAIIIGVVKPLVGAVWWQVCRSLGVYPWGVYWSPSALLTSFYSWMPWVSRHLLGASAVSGATTDPKEPGPVNRDGNLWKCEPTVHQEWTMSLIMWRRRAFFWLLVAELCVWHRGEVGHGREDQFQLWWPGIRQKDSVAGP